MNIDTIQTSFSTGEIGPSLYGRTDIAQYANACQIVRNMIPRSYGSVISMPGTRYVATVSDSSLRTRLLKFVFNQTDSYIIEAGEKYFRFFTNRGQVITSVVSEDLSGISNLISQWKCNDNTNSTTVLDNQASHNGTASTLTSTLHDTGKSGTGSFNLNGVYSISVSDHDDFTRTASTQPMTIMGWAYFRDNGSVQAFFTKYDFISATFQREYEILCYPNGNLRFNVWDEDNDVANNWIASGVIQTGWNFIAVTFAGDGNSATDCQMYLNGVALNPAFTANASYVKMKNTPALVGIGARNVSTSSDLRWNDKLDNIAFFHKVLSSVEINSIYTSSAYQVSSPYLAEDLDNIQYTQLNDVIWIANANYPPQQLVRTSASEWTRSEFNFIGGPFLDVNTNTSVTITPSATAGTINITVSPTNSNLFTLSGNTLGHHNSYWMIGGLALTNATTGLQETGYVKINHVINSYTATATVIKTLKAASATTNWAEGAWSAVRGYPSKVTLQERRLWFARTNYEPQKEWGSRVFAYNDYALDTQADDDALNLGLASNQSNEIQWLASGKSLIAGTFGGAFVTNSKSTEPITSDNVNASEEIGFGSNSVMPKKIGSFLYFIQRFGKKLREMFYNWDLDTYKAVDKTILSPHILVDGVIDMDAQTNPETLLYCVLTSGTLATMTREVDQEVTGWAKHTTDGTYSSIAIIPSQASNYDEAWVIVERWINGVRKKYVEFFEDIEVPERQENCLYLHSALSYDAYNVTSLSSVTISLSASSGSVTLTSSTGYFNGGMINKRLRAINQSGTVLGEGTITGTNSTTSISLSITTTFTALSFMAGFWGVSVSTVSGLSHLEAKTVGILADGVTESLTRTIASGAVTLGSNYFVISVGLSYDQILMTLPKEFPTQKGTVQGKWQRFNNLGFKVNRSTQNFKYGPDSSNLDNINKSFTPSSTSLYTGVLPPQGGGIAMRGGYQRGATIYLRNSEPLPLEVLSIMGSLETTED